MALLSVALVGPLSVAGPAGAGEAEPYLTAGDVLPGSCSPETVLYGQLVDCRFPLARAAPLDPWFGPHVADQDLEFDNENDEQADCVVEGLELVCRGLSTYYGLGGRRVRAVVSGATSEASAGFEAVPWTDYGFSLSPPYGREPYVFAGDSLELWMESAEGADIVFARITARDGDEPAGTVPLGPVRSHTFELVEIDVTSLPVGRYRVTPCIGETAESCDPVPGGQVFQVGADDLLEVIPGWNRPEADRINIVFAPSGFDTVDQAMETVRLLLGWEGPMALGYNGRPVPVGANAELISLVEFGPFAIQPLASSKTRFNIWLLDGIVADPRALVHSAPPFGVGPPAPDFGLPDIAVTSLHLHAIGRFGRSEAGWSSFTSPDGHTAVSRDGLEFGGTYLALPRGWPLEEASTLAHEWGHSLFDLRDEYVEAQRGVTHGYPNCAPDRSTAESWWGDLVGEIDPFVYDYIAALERSEVWVDPLLSERVRIGYEEGGCYSDEADAVRPTADSIMNSAMPVFGSVNRRRVEEILALWTGRVFLSDPSDLEVSCEAVTAARPSVVCEAKIAPFVDVPAGGIMLTIDGHTTSFCSVASGGDSVPTVLACREMPLSGPGPWEITVGTASGSVSVAVTLAGPPPPTTTTTSTTIPPPLEVEPRGFPIWPLAAGGLMLLALVLVTALRRGRR